MISVNVTFRIKRVLFDTNITALSKNFVTFKEKFIYANKYGRDISNIFGKI